MPYITKLVFTAIAIILVCCVSLPTEAAIKRSECVYWNLEQSVTIKNNKALCSLQDENGAHLKKVLAEVVRTGENYVLVSFVVQRETMKDVARVECR